MVHSDERHIDRSNAIGACQSDYSIIFFADPFLWDNNAKYVAPFVAASSLHVDSLRLVGLNLTSVAGPIYPVALTAIAIHLLLPPRDSTRIVGLEFTHFL